MALTTELLALCDTDVAANQDTLDMSKLFPRLFRINASAMILPIQDSMTVLLPATATLKDTHRPFPANAPVFFSECCCPHIAYQYLIRM